MSSSPYESPSNSSKTESHSHNVMGEFADSNGHPDFDDQIRKKESMRSPRSLSASLMPLPLLETVLSSLPESLRTEQKSAPAKKPPIEKKWRWKKPIGRPKRPLSAYNLFFRQERQSLRNVRNLNDFDDSDKALGFAGLAKHVSTKWKNLDDETKQIFEELAVVEKQKYFVSVDEWKKTSDVKDANLVEEESNSMERAKETSTLIGKAAVNSSAVNPTPPGTQFQNASHYDEAMLSNSSAMQHQQNFMIAQMVLSQQMAMDHHYSSMSAVLQDQATTMAHQYPFIGAYARSSSMPMATMENQNRSDPVIPKTQRSASMPRGMQTKWAGTLINSESEHFEHDGEDCHDELIQADTVTDLPNFPSRRMSLPVIGAERRIGEAIRFSRRSASMPLVNMEYTNSNESSSIQEGHEFFDSCQRNSRYVNNSLDHSLDEEWGDCQRDGIVSNRRLSMPVVTSGQTSESTVNAQRRSCSMPMINMRYISSNHFTNHHEVVEQMGQNLQLGNANREHVASSLDMNMEDEFDDLLSQLRGST